MSIEWDGQPPLLVLETDDGKSTPIPLSERDGAGVRSALIACCDCGLVHELMIHDSYFMARRTPEAEAEKVRAATLSHDPNYFPLRRRGGGA